MTNPAWWVERYLKNNWEYQDEKQDDIPLSIFAKAIVRATAGRKTTGYDVARDGVGNAAWVGEPDTIDDASRKIQAAVKQALAS